MSENKQNNNSEIDIDMLDSITGGTGGGIYVSEDTKMNGGSISGFDSAESEVVRCPECGGILDLSKNSGHEIKYLTCPHCKKLVSVII